MNPYKLKEIKETLSKLQTTAKKSFSQNFLIDQNIVDKFINSADVKKDETILEIGPGLGELTLKILEKDANLIAIEKDKFFSAYLKSLKLSNLKVIEADFLKIDLHSLSKEKLKVISSVPYSLTSPIIIKLFKSYELFSTITLMIQKEVAQRILASPNTKEYGSFTVFTNFYASIELVCNVSNSCFYPRPRVDSSIIQMKIKKIDTTIDREKFHKFVQLGFSQRRKKILNCLKPILEKEKILTALESIGFDENTRAESLSLENFISLYKKLF